MEWPWPTADLDGDGVFDLLATINAWLEKPGHGYVTRRLPAAFSGRDGRRLWIGESLDILASSGSASGSGWSYQYPYLDQTDLDRDGRAEVLAVAAPMGQPARLSVVSAQDGRMVWSAPIGRGSFGLQPSPAGKPLADFNGDRVLDLALWVPADASSSEYGPLQVNPLHGRTGKPLWPNSAVVVSHPDRRVWPELAVADLDRDGMAEVLVTRHGGYHPRKNHYECELLALDGGDGSVRWRWTWQAGFPEIWPPIPVAGGRAGHALVCVVIQTNGIYTLVALDAYGKERVRRGLDLPGRQVSFGRFVWRAADVNADGVEELLYLDDGKLCAAGGEALDVQWRWVLPDEATLLVEVRAMASGLPPSVVVWSGKDTYGIDGASGQPQWRTRVAYEPLIGSSEMPEVRRLEASSGVLPRVQHVVASRYANQWASVVRQTWPTDAAGKYLAPKATAQSFSPVKEVVVPRRLLPWAEDDDMAWVFSGVWALLGLGLPGVLVWWAVGRGNRLAGLLALVYAGLSWLLPIHATIPALVAMGYGLWMSLEDGRKRHWASFAVSVVCTTLAGAILLASLTLRTPLGEPIWRRALTMVVAGIPGLAFWAMCGWAISKRRWSRVWWLVAGSVAAAVLAAIPALWRDLPWRMAGETYALRGAGYIWFVGIGLTGLVGLVALGGPRVWRMIQRLRAAGRPTTQRG